MTAKELLLAMEEVEDRYLLQADVFGGDRAPVGVLRGFFKWAGAVAAVLIVGAGFWFMGSLGLLGPVDSGSHSIAAGYGSRSSQTASSQAGEEPSASRPAPGLVLTPAGGEDSEGEKTYQNVGNGLVVIGYGEESSSPKESGSPEVSGAPTAEPTPPPSEELTPLDLTDGELNLMRSSVFAELGFYLNYFSNDGRYPVTERSVRQVRITYFRPERGTDHPGRSYYGELEVRFKPRAGDEEHWISWMGDTVRGTGEDQGYLVTRRSFIFDESSLNLSPGGFRRPDDPAILESTGYQPVEPVFLGDQLTLPALRAIMRSPEGLTLEALEPYGYVGRNSRSYDLPEGYDLDVWVEDGKLTKTAFTARTDRRLAIDLLTDSLEAYLLLVGDR